MLWPAVVTLMQPNKRIRPCQEADSVNSTAIKSDSIIPQIGRVKSSRLEWPSILATAKAVVQSYDTSVTLRQLFYRLVAAELLPNTSSAYKSLSSQTAAARRAGAFPALIDRTRTIHEDLSFNGVGDAVASTISWYRRDRTEGQECSIYLAVEKNGLVEQLREWFGNCGFPILALGGYCGQSYVDDVRRHVERQDRPAILLYAGDFDPSGEDIDRDFVARTDCWTKVQRVALTAEQVERFDLPPQPGKSSDSRARAFTERHGRLVQVEVDALPPDTLKRLFKEAVEPLWDTSIFDDVVAQEDAERDVLKALAAGGAK